MFLLTYFLTYLQPGTDNTKAWCCQSRYCFQRCLSVCVSVCPRKKWKNYWPEADVTC